MMHTKKVILIFFMVFTTIIFADDNIPCITVTGKSAISLSPDKIVLHLSILTSDKILKTAKVKNSLLSSSIHEVIKSFKIKKENVQTRYLTMSPVYARNSSGLYGENLIGYNVTNKIIVELEELKQFDSLVTKLLEANVSSIDNVILQSSKLDATTKEARKMAIIAAKEKAIYLAEELGQKIGNAISIVENPASNSTMSSYPNPFNSQQYIPGGTDYTSSDVSLGKISISAEIKAVFELK